MSAATVTPEAIAPALGGILEMANTDARHAYLQLASSPAVQAALAAVRERDSSDFFFSLLYPMEQVVDGLLHDAIPGSRYAQFIFKHSRFVESHLGRLIRAHEGSACSHDKVMAITGRLLAHYLTGQVITFDWTAKYTYHYPTKIFTTHEAIVEFFEGLYGLYFGEPSKYLVALEGVTRAAKESAGD